MPIKTRTLKWMHDKGYYEKTLKLTCDCCSTEFVADHDDEVNFTKEVNEYGFRVVENDHMICVACKNCIPDIGEDDTL